MSLRRVVVTGLGMVSCLGSSVNQSWAKLLNGESGIKSIKSIPNIRDDPNYPDIYMGIVSNFDEKAWKVQYINTRLNQFAYSATNEAILDSGLDMNSEQLRTNTGVNIGIMQTNQTKLSEIMIEASQKGPIATASTACATGASAIGDAYHKIQLGKAKVMIAGGSEESLCPASIYAAIRMQAMSVKKYNDPNESSRPFDKDRSGFILSEGSGIIILEELEHALKRGANIYAELVGYGCTSDGYHLTRPMESGEGGRQAMELALSESGIDKSDINLINCHATSTVVGDESEVKAINNFFTNDRILIGNCLITANKSQIGHTFGAAGSIESIFSILSLQNQIVPPILNLQDPIKLPYLNYSLETQHFKINSVLKNSFGFGGVNVSLIFTQLKR